MTAPLTPAAIFLVVTIDEGGEAAVHDGLPDISGLVRAVGFRDPGNFTRMFRRVAGLTPRQFRKSIQA